MKFINKLERRFGKYAINNLMKYVITLYALGLLANVQPGFYEKFLMLDIDMVLKGQVWRIITFIVQPIYLDGSPFTMLFVALELYLYYVIGNTLERAWGSFRLNLYYLSGILLNFVAILLVYLVTYLTPGMEPISISFGLQFINRSLFFAFATIVPNMQFLFMFIIPVKVKYLAYIYGAVIGYDVIKYIMHWIQTGNVIVLSFAISIIVSFGNFIMFFLGSRKLNHLSPSAIKRRSRQKQRARQIKNQGNHVIHQGESVVTRHKCTVCNKTELDDYELEFRFCSRCKGNYEYCMEHLFTHEHKK